MLGQNPYAEEALALSSASRGLQGMVSPTPPGPEAMLSGGPTDKVMANNQPYNNANHTGQSIQQNMMTSGFQTAANGIRGARKNVTDMSQQEMKAQQLLATRAAETLYANDGGAALMRVNQLMSDPASQQEFMRRIGESKLMAQGNNPQRPYQSINTRA